MKFHIVRNAWWMFWADGMVFWPWVWFKKGMVTDDRLFRHELEHCYQVKRTGRFRFIVRYLWLFIRYGYKRHPYEIEAEEKEVLALSETELQWRAQGSIVISW